MAPQAVMQKIEITIPQEEMVKVLVIDDDDSFQRNMKEFFESMNCKADVANSPEQARPLLSQNYDLIIADVNFDTSRIKGDRFVLDNYKSLGPARIVVLTGQGLETIDKFRKLEKRGIDIYEKSDNELAQNLEAIAQGKFEEKEANFLKSVSQSISSTLGQTAAAAAAVTMATVRPPTFDPAAQLQVELKRMLVSWLESRSQRDIPVLAFGNSMFTANQMIGELQNDSEVGQAHVRMFVSEIKNNLGLRDDATI